MPQRHRGLLYSSPCHSHYPLPIPTEETNPQGRYCRRSIDMQANNIDNASENSQEENVCGNGNLNAAAHELNSIRADALRRIDEGGFSCVAGLSLSLHACSPSRCFTAGFILNYALSPARGFSRTRESSSPSCHASYSILILERLGMISSQST
jgi:hypothetical protein